MRKEKHAFNGGSTKRLLYKEMLSQNREGFTKQYRNKEDEDKQTAKQLTPVGIKVTFVLSRGTDQKFLRDYFFVFKNCCSKHSFICTLAFTCVLTLIINLYNHKYYSVFKKRKVGHSRQWKERKVSSLCKELNQLTNAEVGETVFPRREDTGWSFNIKCSALKTHIHIT